MDGTLGGGRVSKSPKIYADIINGWSPGGGVLTLVSKVLKYCGNTMLKSCGWLSLCEKLRKVLIF